MITLENTSATLTAYPMEQIDQKAKGAVIVLPGGGYNSHADHEGEPVAKAYNSAGYHAFVLRYRVEEKPLQTAPLYDVCTAIAYVRSLSETLDIPKDTIAVCGFSAGGHLAGSAGVFWHMPELFGGTRPAEEYRPNTTILCYPVLSEEYPHEGSFTNLVGPDKKKWEAVSLDKQVNSHTAPSFLWHTAEDASVPVGNTLRFAESLARYHIPMEVHVFPEGPHGVGLATKESGSKTHDPYTARWHTFSVAWLDKLFG